MIILDTNVLSEPFRAAPDQNVMRWFASIPLPALFVTTTTVMELHAGMYMLQEGKQKSSLAKIIKDQIENVYHGRILDFDIEAANICGKIIAETKRNGREPKISDCQIASIAMKRGFTIATRNTKDFQHKGLRVINPWAG